MAEKKETAAPIADALATEQQTATIDTTIEDPWAYFNKPMLAFNLALYRHVLREISQWYIDYMPAYARTGVGNFFSNMEQPHVAANHLLQGDWDTASQATARFVFNSTIGIAGLVDVGKLFLNLPPTHADLGQTLAVWGMPSGPYWVLPLVGPSSLRHSTGVLTQVFLNPLNTLSSSEARLTASSFRLLDKQAQIHPRMPVVLDSIDPYVTARDLFIQSRQNFLLGDSRTDKKQADGVLIIEDDDFFNDAIWLEEE